jgi:septal ring factor EnvC (AmiA/AmiB activator)
MFSQNSKVAVLESKLDMYEDLSREMLSKLESAVEKISEGNNRIAQILTKHDERIEQSMKTDDLIIKMIDEVKSESEKDHKIIHERIDKIEQNINALSKFKWQAGAAAAVLALLVGAGSRIAPFFLTPPTQPVIIENQK